MRRSILAPVSILLTACRAAVPPEHSSETELPLFGNGYPAPGDPCMSLGEAEQTRQYLDHTSDLIACPVGMENLDSFINETGARELFRQDGYVAYAIQRD